MVRGFSTSISGLNNAQHGLYVTGHNMANTSTIGYTRQQALGHDFGYQNIGNNMQVGLGADITMIRQIRNQYLDVNFRKEVGKATYYNVQYNVGHDIENILGELESDFSSKNVTNDVWSSLHELQTHPSGLETRGNFVSTAQSYINKLNNIYDRLQTEQHNLNNDIKSSVIRINQITTRIEELNKMISGAEASGQRANDFRDERNLLLDELGGIVKIEYKENMKGEIAVSTNGKELVSNGWAFQIGLRYSTTNSSFVEPVFTTSTDMLPYDPTGQNARPLFDYYGVIGLESGRDQGELFSLMVARGLHPVDYTSFKEMKDTLPVVIPNPLNLSGINKNLLIAPFPPANDADRLTLLTNINNIIDFDPDYITASPAEKEALLKLKEQVEGHINYHAALNAFGGPPVIKYPPHIPVNNVDGNGFTLTPGAYAGPPAIPANIGGFVMPNPYDLVAFPGGIYDPAYITAVKAILDTPALEASILVMENFFKDPHVEATLPNFHQQYADFKVFRDGVKAYSADMVRLEAEISQQPLSSVLVEFNNTQCTIPKAMRQLDELFNYTLNLINDELSKGFDLNESTSQTKIFVTKDGSSRFTMGNVTINPDLLDPEGYNLMCLGIGNGRDSDTYVKDLLTKWNEKNLSIDGSILMNIENGYDFIVNEIAVKARKDLSTLEGQTLVVADIDNKRSQISGVSLDEEMKNMMIYQHAFNAASRMINVIDSMLDTVINRTGRVGI